MLVRSFVHTNDHPNSTNGFQIQSKICAVNNTKDDSLLCT